jgi:hypothetical protein
VIVQDGFLDEGVGHRGPVGVAGPVLDLLPDLPNQFGQSCIGLGKGLVRGFLDADKLQVLFHELEDLRLPRFRVQVILKVPGAEAALALGQQFGLVHE